jgi:hypothetical protein
MNNPINKNKDNLPIPGIASTINKTNIPNLIPNNIQKASSTFQNPLVTSIKANPLNNTEMGPPKGSSIPDMLKGSSMPDMSKFSSMPDMPKVPSINDITDELSGKVDIDNTQRNVDIKENSKQLGIMFRKDFDKYLKENGLDEIDKIAMDGFKTYFNENVVIDKKPLSSYGFEYLIKSVGSSLIMVIGTFVTLSVNAKEQQFKSKLFYSILDKFNKNGDNIEISWKKNSKYCVTKDNTYCNNETDAVPENSTSPYYKTLIQNIGKKLVNILRTYNGGAMLSSASFPNVGKSPFINNLNPFGSKPSESSGFLNSPLDTMKNAVRDETQSPLRGGENSEKDKSPDIEPFLDNRSQELIKKYFSHDVSSKEILERISTEITKMVFDIYNDPENRENLCVKVVDPFVDKIIEKTIVEIVALFCTNTTNNDNKMENEMNESYITLPLETLYILLDDPYIQRIVRDSRNEISKNASRLLTPLDNDDADKVLNEILQVLKSSEKNKKKQGQLNENKIGKLLDNFIKSLSNKSPSGVDAESNVSMKDSTQPPSMPTNDNNNNIVMNGGENIHTGSADYIIDIIFGTVPQDTLDKVSTQLSTTIDKKSIVEIIDGFFTNNQKKFITEPQMYNIHNLVHNCLFETLTETFMLHVFYMNTIYNSNLEIDLSAYKTDDIALIKDYKNTSKEPEWVDKVVTNVVVQTNNIQSGGGGGDTENNDREKNGQENNDQPVSDNTTSTLESPEMEKNDSTTSKNSSMFDISYTQDYDKDSKPVPSNTPQINHSFNDLILDHFLIAFKDKETKDKIKVQTNQIIEDNLNKLLNDTPPTGGGQAEIPPSNKLSPETNEGTLSEGNNSHQSIDNVISQLFNSIEDIIPSDNYNDKQKSIIKQFSIQIAKWLIDNSNISNPVEPFDLTSFINTPYLSVNSEIIKEKMNTKEDDEDRMKNIIQLKEEFKGYFDSFKAEYEKSTDADIVKLYHNIEKIINDILNKPETYNINIPKLNKIKEFLTFRTTFDLILSRAKAYTSIIPSDVTPLTIILSVLNDLNTLKE